ncbi:putative spermidine/putrescine transport system substrate-binding protein [Nonomuraea jiangxiensis]|uniref:Putative spermidine/putrescine transport system substrate-binding protein n=1 Tax=Nonomuraea jiangxiensis TaxID=633440 RepID=A0A1G9TA60_9ACTN|nr:putative spermidine/putrescine transport system substrate-binding protein [Nonomuraea jiangxiensis]
MAISTLVATMGAASPTPTPTPSPSATQSDGTLRILTYRGYAEYGGISSRVNWVGSFEKETGCRIAKLDTVETAADMAELAKQPYDVISAGPVLAAELIAAKQVQPLDPAKIAGYDDIDERFRDMSKVSGRVYGVPYLWASHEFLYDSTRVKGSLRQAFETDRAALEDSPLTIADAAMAAGSLDDPFELTESRLDDTIALLKAHKHRSYWRSPIDLVKGFATGALDYAQATPYYRLLLKEAGLPVKAVRTAETTGWVDSWMLGAHLPDTTCAYRWLDWVTAPDAQRDAAAWVGMAPANGKACKGRARVMCETYGVGDDKRLDRIAFAVRPPGDCRAEDGECTDYAAWAERWSTLAQ